MGFLLLRLRIIKDGLPVEMFSEDEMRKFESKILAANIVDKDSRKQHVQQIRTKVKSDNTKISTGVCPRCGGNLIKREGKYGSFLGCSNYPKCKYTSKI